MAQTTKILAEIGLLSVEHYFLRKKINSLKEKRMRCLHADFEDEETGHFSFCRKYMDFKSCCKNCQNYLEITKRLEPLSNKSRSIRRKMTHLTLKHFKDNA